MHRSPLHGSPLEGDDFVVHEWRDDGTTSAERPVAPLHIHHEDDEAWIVLEGSLGFRVGAEQVIAAAGDAVLAPAGVPHSYWNAGGGDARYLIVMTPRIAGLLSALHEPGALDDPSGLYRWYASELLE